MRFVPFAPLFAAAAWLGIQWDEIPATWLVTWDLGWPPDGYAYKSVTVVFAPVLFGTVLALVLEAVATMTERAGRARFPSLARAHGNIVRWLSLAVSAGVGVAAAWFPLAPPDWLFRPEVPVPFVMIPGGVVVALGGAMLELRRASRRMAERGERLPPGHGLLLYLDRDDPRLLVPKISGIGWTLNFARPAAWLLLLAVPSAVILLVSILADV